jgi:hypothetical protein
MNDNGIYTGIQEIENRKLKILKKLWLSGYKRFHRSKCNSGEFRYTPQEVEAYTDAFFEFLIREYTQICIGEETDSENYNPLANNLLNKIKTEITERDIVHAKKGSFRD